MIKKLIDIKEKLPALLSDRENWKSLYVDYHPPLVERLYMDYEDVRISIHRLHKCEPSDALIHPHPWPAAFMVFGGYQTAFGYSETIDAPENMSRVIMNEGCYEMMDKNLWHYVAPLETCITIMVSGKPWGRDMPIKPAEKLRALTDRERSLLFDDVEKLLR